MIFAILGRKPLEDKAGEERFGRDGRNGLEFREACPAIAFMAVDERRAGEGADGPQAGRSPPASRCAQGDRPMHDHFFAQSSAENLESAAERGKDIAVHVAADRVEEERIVGHGNAPAEDDDIRGEKGNSLRNGPPEDLRGAFERRFRDLVAA